MGKGEVVWGLADLKLPLRVGEDVSNNYLLFWTSYDASAAHSYGLTSVRVVCANTLRLALSGKSAQILKVRHTKSGEQRLKEAHFALQTLDGHQDGGGETELPCPTKDDAGSHGGAAGPALPQDR